MSSHAYIYIQAVTSLRSRLVPYFIIRHTTRGRLSGPYSKLSPPLRTLMLDLVFASTKPRRHDELDDAVLDVVADREKSYWASLSVLSCN